MFDCKKKKIKIKHWEHFYKRSKDDRSGILNRPEFPNKVLSKSFQICCHRAPEPAVYFWSERVIAKASHVRIDQSCDTEGEKSSSSSNKDN